MLGMGSLADMIDCYDAHQHVLLQRARNAQAGIFAAAQVHETEGAYHVHHHGHSFASILAVCHARADVK